MIGPLYSGTLIRSPWTETFNHLLSRVEESLVLVSPFIKRSKTGAVIANLENRGVQDKVKVEVLTDLRPESVLNGATDLEALTDLADNLHQVVLTYMPSLHAKVYVADKKMAIVTSANLTDSGMSGNLEYGVAFADEPAVGQIREDFKRYSLLGAQVSLGDLRVLAGEMVELKELFKNAQQSIRVQAKRAFRQKLQATHIQLLRHRAKGKTTNAIFSEAIVFLLSKGPLHTTELHPLIQSLHPDICDDAIDRIIDGVNFGKRWKHYVRNAQQLLKRQGQIRYDGQQWHLVS